MGFTGGVHLRKILKLKEHPSTKNNIESNLNFVIN